MPISYQQRRDNAIKKAVAALTPYVERSLRSSFSSAIDRRAADALKEGIRKHFWGFKGAKNESVEHLHLSKAEQAIAIAQAIRECLQSPSMKSHLARVNAERKAELDKVPFNPFGPGDGRRKTIKKFKPLVTRRVQHNERVVEQVLLAKMEAILNRKRKQ